MNALDALEIVQAAIWTVIVASAPAVVAAMVVGIVIALLQALTQIQEMTLTFIPKILVILFVSFMTDRMKNPELFETSRHALNFNFGGINNQRSGVPNNDERALKQYDLLSASGFAKFTDDASSPTVASHTVAFAIGFFR